MNRFSVAALLFLLSGADAKDPDSSYAALVRDLPQARKVGKVDTLFVRFLDKLRIAGHKEENAASALVKRWVEDAVRETHEETRIWYSLGMNEVRGLGAGGITMAHSKIRTGGRIEIIWSDPEGKKGPPKGTSVELAVQDGDPSAGRPARYRPLETSSFRKDSTFHAYRKVMAKPGNYRVSVRSDYFFQQTYVQVGDLDLVLKEDGERFLVWGSSPGNRLRPPYRIRATGPDGWSKDAKTDSQGLALLDIPKDPAFRSGIKVALEKDGHRAFASMGAREKPRGYLSIWFFTDRPRYRPGDRVHIRGVAKHRVADSFLEDRGPDTLELDVYDRRGKRIRRSFVPVDPWGNFGDSLDLLEDAELGAWRINAGKVDSTDGRNGWENGRTIEFRVEEYRKPDFRILADPRWTGRDGKLSLRVEARYPDGAPVQGIPVVVQWFEDGPDRDFDPIPAQWDRRRTWSPYSRGYESLRVDTLRLGAGGKAERTLEPPEVRGQPAWVLELSALDKTGRAVQETFRLRRTLNKVGIKVEMDMFHYEAGNPALVKVAARDTEGDPMRGEVFLKFKRYKETWLDTVLTFDAAGKALMTLFLDRPGEFSVLADLDPESPESPVSEASFLVSETIRSGKDPALRVQLHSAHAVQGDSVRFRLRGSWGKSPLLVSLEGASLGSWKVLQPGDGRLLHEALHLSRDAAPRAQVWAQFSGPLGWETDSAAFDLPDSALLLRATLESKAEWKPGETFKGRIRITDARGRPAQARFSLGVVDEAVHQGVNIVAKPASILFPDRRMNRVRTRLGEDAGETFWALAGLERVPSGVHTLSAGAQALWDPFDKDSHYNRMWRWYRERNRGATFHFGPITESEGFKFANASAVYIMGSGEGIDGDGNTSWSPRADFRDRAYWNPMISTDASGRADVEFPWPADIARWRVSARGTGPGGALLDFRDSLVTRLDLSVRLALPRAFSVGDSALVTALAVNATGKVLQGEVEFGSGDSSVALPKGPGTRTLALPPGTTAVRFPLRILKAGRAELKVALRAEGRIDGEVRSCPVMESGYRVVTAGAGLASPSGRKPGNMNALGFTLDPGYRPGSAQVEVEVYSVPNLSLLGPVENLVQYPYGCAEQTLSRFLPLVHVLEALRKAGIRKDSLEKRAMDLASIGMDRLEAMQLEGGGWGWWNRSDSDPYITALVADGMHQASRSSLAPFLRRRAGELRDRSLKVLSKSFNAAKTPPDDAVFITHALSLALPAAEWKAGLARAWMDRDRLSIASLGRLLNLYRRAGMPAEEKSVLELFESRLRLPDRREQPPGWDWLEADIQGQAEALDALMEYGNRPESAARIAAWLHRVRQGEGWGSTRSTALVLRALTRYGVSEPRIPTDGRARFEINSVRLLEEPLAPGRDGAVLQRWTLAGPLLDSALRIGANSLRAFHTGSGSLHYSARVLRHSDSTPRPAHGGAPISLKRSYRKAWHVLEDGTWKRRTAPLAGKAVKPGDEVVVILEVSSPDGGRYALVEDPIPAGMEYLPRGQVQHGTKETYALEGTEHFEVRDGKAAFFTSSLSRGGNTFVYSLRAETRGRFQARPARVELMYRPEVNAVSRPSAVAVRP